MTCTEKHTKYQPTQDEWKCPKCGAGVGTFYIDESPNHDCDLIHNEDTIMCMGLNGDRCDYLASGKSFVQNLVKKKNMVPCPHCKGKGMVQG